MEYRREIDGLRALAVLPVILSHAGFETFSGGFVGVDVFFVISGYLITSIILAERQAGTFTLAGFYERRARRILPALFFVLFACLPFAWLWLLPADMANFSDSVIAVAGFASNVLFWQTSNYFATAAELKPLLHTWTLAVEEQFYVLYPILLLAALRLGRRWVLCVLSFLAVLSLAAAHWGATWAPMATFYLLPMRGWELLIGALAAFHLQDRTGPGAPRAVAEGFGALGLLLIGCAVFAYENGTAYLSLYALVPALGTALVILFATRQTWTGKVLGVRVLVGLGLISYSVYLWHQPMFAFARHASAYGAPGKPLLAALAVAAVALGWFSWKVVETPFRNRQRFTRREILVLSIACSFVLAAFGLAGHLSSGFAGRMPAVITQPDFDLPRTDNGWCFYSVDSDASLPVGAKGVECWLGDKASLRKGILFGDSYAGQYEPLWDLVGRNAGVAIHSVTTNWCNPGIDDTFVGDRSSRAVGQCLFNRRYLRENLSKVDFVVFAGNWGILTYQNRMEGLLEMIGQAAAHTRLVVVMATPRQFDADVMTIYKKTLLYGTKFDASKLGTYRDSKALEAERLLEAEARKYRNVLYVDRESLFGADGLASGLTRDGIPFSFEGLHISIYGAKAAAREFMESPKYNEFLSALQ